MERQPLPFNRAVFEAQAYRPSMRSFFEAARENPGLLVDVDLREDATVLDVGAFEGLWARQVLARADARGPSRLVLHAFEPEVGAATQLSEAMQSEARFKLHPFGLAGTDRVESLTLAGPGSSVFLSPTTTESFGTMEVPLRDVASVLSTLSVDRIDLVKINIEGGEFELIDRLYDTGWLSRTGTLIVQFHEFAPKAHRARRRNRRQLSETHRCTWSHKWVFERWDPR